MQDRWMAAGDDGGERYQISVSAHHMVLPRDIIRMNTCRERKRNKHSGSWFSFSL